MRKGILSGLAFIIVLCFLSNIAYADNTWWWKYVDSNNEPVRCETPWGDIGAVSSCPAASVQLTSITIITQTENNIKMNLFDKITLQFGFISRNTRQILGLSASVNAKGNLSNIR
jgi:hypothetical protein